MNIQSLVDTAVYESFYLAGIGNEISLEEFKKKAEQIGQIVEDVLSFARETPLTLENQKIITRAVLRTNERMILRLYNYVMQKEEGKASFHGRTRDNVVKYLGRIKVYPVIPDSKLVDKKKIDHLIEVFNASNLENNRIDWKIVNGLFSDFDKMQRRSFEINSLPLSNLN